MFIYKQKLNFEEDIKMSKEIIIRVTATEGECKVGHKVGDVFKVSPADSGGLCGAAYHTVFPIIAVLQWDGVLPGDDPNKIDWCCPDVKNLTTFEIVRQEAEE
jgi:uncharacterized repeat protein (TIGR04076 family)